jgi:hypothetical protein
MTQRVIKCLLQPAWAFITVLSACSTITSPPPETGLSHDKTQKILSGMLALVEAQHTYYVHVTHSTKFAANISELGCRNEKGGTVMVLAVWNANADAPKIPLEGYFFKLLPFANGPGEKDGFAVAAVAAVATQEKEEGRSLPIFLTIVKSVKGGISGMSLTDTWGIRDLDLIKKMRAFLWGNPKLDAETASLFMPSTSNRTQTFSNFSPEVLP